jgi:hypothetical protein
MEEENLQDWADRNHIPIRQEIVVLGPDEPNKKHSGLSWFTKGEYVAVFPTRKETK